MVILVGPLIYALILTSSIVMLDSIIGIFILVGLELIETIVVFSALAVML